MQRVVMVETRRCALTGEEFVPRVPWQKYSKPDARRKAHRPTLAKLRAQLTAMAAKLQEADRNYDNLLGDRMGLQKRVTDLQARLQQHGLPVG